MEELKKTLEGCFAAQIDAVEDWHEVEPEAIEGGGEISYAMLVRLVLRQHLYNFKLWHVEDTARRKDVDASVIADCKQRIDGLNQRRNDAIEEVDACLMGLVAPTLPQGSARAYNTETIGAALDRLSILALKLFHMDEQTRRDDVGIDHVAACREKLAVMREQHQDLCAAILHLLDEYAAGTKRPKVYFQFKMYNDPSLNPELYKNK